MPKLCLPRTEPRASVRFFHPLGWVLLGLMGALPVAAWAASVTPPVSVAAPNGATGAANWATVLQQTETRLSQQIITEADVMLTRAEQARANGWLANAPIIDGLYRSDQPMSNRGAVEMQTDVRLPLRRFGQTQAWHTLATQTALNGQTRAQANTLVLLGSLRQLAWDWRRADAQLAAAQIRLDLMTRDLKAVTQQVKRGDAAEVDRLSVESRLLAVQDQQAAAQMMRDNAAARWHQMTGFDALPSDLGASNSATVQQLNNPAFDTPDGLLAEQPLLKQMASDVGLTTARIAAERAAGAGAPELGLGVKRDRGDRGMPYDNSLFVTLSLPIGGQKYRDPALAAMTQQRATAQVALIKTTQQLLGDATALRQRINAWPQRLARLDNSAALAEKTLSLKQKARQMGELDWSQVLSFERDAADARLQAKLAHIEYAADLSSLKQTLGLMPQN
ncbi:MAG TPA: TolC family protein [Halothiobacillus sp.]|nr:TolC family protein [Halothiobacillus sp.]HQS29875.1 TolC family protein [Halothiobacillus sp.]